MDLRAIEQQTTLQIFKTLARYKLTGEVNTKQLRGIEPPLLWLRAQQHRVFFHDRGDCLEIFRVLDRKEAYRLVERDGTICRSLHLIDWLRSWCVNMPH